MPPIRVLVLTASSDIGGAERQIAYLARHIDRAAFALRVVSFEGDGRLTAMVREAGHEAETLGARRWLWRVRTRGVFRGFRPQVAHLFGLRVDAVARLVARQSGAAVISAIRNTDPWRRWWHVWLDRSSAHHVDLFLSNSEAGRRSRIEREGFAADRIEVIPNGTPLPDLARREALRTQFRAAHGIPAEAPLVGLVANYRPQKGHRTLLAALAAAPEWRAVFAGDDHMRAAIHTEAARLGGRVLCLGHQRDLAPLYAALDAFALPSAYEGMPNTLMEAMAWGLPCIASPTGGIPEVAGADGGVAMVGPEDAAALSGELRALLADPARRASRGAAARARIEREFSITAMVRRHEDVYRRLAEARRA
jgi:glycosyltransferase involved in cell wall biosynthesis